MNYLISDKLAGELLVYLSERPFKEVNSFITQLGQLKLVNIVPPQPTEPAKGDDTNVQSEKSQSKESNANG